MDDYNLQARQKVRDAVKNVNTHNEKKEESNGGHH
jgi:hypothetical protein